MPLQVAIQMDPIERVNIDGDTTFFLMLEAQARATACSSTARTSWPSTMAGCSLAAAPPTCAP